MAKLSFLKKFVPGLKTDLLPAIVATGLISLIAWPGFMSYDSIHMLREARGEVAGWIYPTAPVYLLRLFDVFNSGNLLLWLTQVFTVYFFSFKILKNFGMKSSANWVFIFGTILFSELFGSLLVLWKDVTLTSFWLGAFSILTSSASIGKQETYKNYRNYAALALILIGSTLRLNAVLIFIPLFFYWVMKQTWATKAYKKVIASAILLLLSISLNIFLSTFRLPDLKRLEPSPNWYATQTYDLVGIANYSGLSLIPIGQESNKYDVEEIREIFSPLGALEINIKNAKSGTPISLYAADYSNSDISEAWYAAVKAKPLEYLRYRADLFGEIIGLTDHKTFEPTHYGEIDENEFGIKTTPTFLKYVAIGYIYLSSGWFLGKPWFLILVAALAFIRIIARKIKSESNAAIILATSGALYLSAYFLITATGEVRYFFPSGILFLLVLMMSLPIYKQRN